MRKWMVGLLAVGLVLCTVMPSVSASPGNRTFSVVFKAKALPADVDALVASAGGRIESLVPEIGYMTVSGPVSLMERLGKEQTVRAVTPTINLQIAPAQVVEPTDVGEEAASASSTDLYQAYQWDIRQVTGEGASWSLSTGSHRTVVGVVDTGINTRHVALRENLLGGRNFVPDGPGNRIVWNDIEDRNGHGSHTASAIAGNGRILGVGPNLGIRAYRVFGAEGGAPTSRVLMGLVSAVNDGVDVVSMSLGGYDLLAGGTWYDSETGVTQHFREVADFIAYKWALQYAAERGVVVVAAAGNDALNIGNPAQVTAYLNAQYGPMGYRFYGASREVPGTLPGVITVSATGPDSSLASYSNFGNPIDVAAPGGDFKRFPLGDWFTDMCLGAYKAQGSSVNTYAWMAGTSMATPKVAAVAALLIDQAKAGGQKLKPNEVANRIYSTAVDLGKASSDPLFGRGRVNAYRALGGK